MALSPDEQARSDVAGTGAFARTTVGLPQFQPFNATAPGVMLPRPAVADPNAGMSYGDQMGHVGKAFMDGLGTAMKFIFNTPGGGGVLDASRFTPGAMPNAAPVSSGGPDRASGPQAVDVDPASTVVKAAGAAAPAKKSATAAPPPRDAQPALVPGETGFYMGNQLVPYGTRFAVGGDGSVQQLDNFASTPATAGKGGAATSSAAAMPAGGGGVVNQQALIDPQSFFDRMAAAQMNYANEAAGRILGQAGDGSQLGYSARLRALASVYLNGLAGVGQGGANAFNSSTASMSNAQTEAGARRYAADKSLTGDLARAGATVRSAEIGVEPHNEANRQAEERTFDTPIPIGQEQVTDPMTGLTTMRTQYGMRQRDGAMPKPISGSLESKRKPKEGDTGNNGTLIYKDGQWVRNK